MTPLLVALILAADVNYIALDLRSHEVISSQWADAEVAIPVGSLVKPFTALAYGGAFPEFECKGADGGCWRKKPHGKIGFIEALAQSCNAYFLQLAGRVDGATLEVTSATFGVKAPGGLSAGQRIGLGDAWRVSPMALLRAYGELAARRGDARVDAILAGMERAARSGTAVEIGRALPGERVLAKTGTAPCVAERKHAGDGFALAMFPAESPRTAVLVQVHGVPGAEAAKHAGRVVKSLRSVR